MDALGFGGLGNLLSNNLASGFGQTSRNYITGNPYGNYGNKHDKLGRNLTLRSGRIAEVTFGLANLKLQYIPNPKFLFYVRFLRNIGGGVTYSQQQQSIGFVLKSIDRPTINLELESVNQYNKIRKVQTKMSYGDVNIVFHDTADLRARKLFEEYFAFYFNEGNIVSSGAWDQDQTNAEMITGADGWGFRIDPSRNPNMSKFFSAIEILQFSQGAYITTQLINPYITSYDPDTLSYEEGQSTQTINMGITFEGLIQSTQYTAMNQSIADETGLSQADFYETEDGPLTGSLATGWQQLNQPARPNILGNTLTNVGGAILGGRDIKQSLTNSAINGLGYYDFSGLNLGSAAGSAMTSGAYGAGSSILAGMGTGGRQAITAGSMNGGSLTTAGAVFGGSLLLNSLSSNSNPSLQAGSSKTSEKYLPPSSYSAYPNNNYSSNSGSSSEFFDSLFDWF